VLAAARVSSGVSLPAIAFGVTNSYTGSCRLSKFLP